MSATSWHKKPSLAITITSYIIIKGDLSASAKQYRIICGWYQTPVLEEEIYSCYSSQKRIIKSFILLSSKFEIMEIISWWMELSWRSLNLFSISNFICSVSHLTAYSSKQIFCTVNFRRSGIVVLKWSMQLRWN